ncbi:MAG TPA: hypothetical protein VNU46_01050 [Gemmatimonadaceae bacterium]|jgi:uncharacterized Zn finger protein|nr:hypothetical protein [Gemmatimonadaceae bacterium]
MSSRRLVKGSGLGSAWLEAVLRTWPEAKRRAAAGRRLAQAERVLDVQVGGGAVSARVVGQRRAVFATTVTMRPVATDVWRAAMGAIALDAFCTTQVRSGVVPRSVLAYFDAAGDSLLPMDAQTVRVECPCAARVELCDHVLAVHHWIAAAVERDPFVLFVIRGSSREQVLGWLAGVDGETLAAVDVKESTDVNAGAQLLGADAAGDAFDAWRAPVDLVQDDVVGERQGVVDTILAQLGDPPGWDMEASVYETLVPVYRAAARYARAITTLAETDAERP